MTESNIDRRTARPLRIVGAVSRQRPFDAFRRYVTGKVSQAMQTAITILRSNFSPITCFNTMRQSVSPNIGLATALVVCHRLQDQQLAVY
jgi:hypothetical protein